MAIQRLAHDGYGMLETNRLDRDNNEAQCALDLTAFPDGAEVGTIVSVDKTAGLVKLSGSLKGILGNSERIYNQFKPGLKNYKVKAGQMASVYFMRKGDTFTTNTVCYDTTDFADDTALITALKAVKTTPLYGIPDTTTGIIKIVKTASTSSGTPAVTTYSPFTVVKLTTMPDGQNAVKFILSDFESL